MTRDDAEAMWNWLFNEFGGFWLSAPVGSEMHGWRTYLELHVETPTEPSGDGSGACHLDVGGGPRHRSETGYRVRPERHDSGLYANAVGRIEAALGLVGDFPVHETIYAVERLVAQRKQIENLLSQNGRECGCEQCLACRISEAMSNE